MRKTWTQLEIDILARLYADYPSQHVAELLGRPVRSVYSKASYMGIKKSELYYNSQNAGRLNAENNTAGMSTRFAPGHIPHNKHKKWSDYVPLPSQEESRKTTFKKGRLPHNTRHDGCITIRRSYGYEYKHIRLSNGTWQMLHVHNWITAHGPVPEGFVVVFKSADRSDCDISNLELCTRDELMRRNSITQYPPVLRQSMNALKKLNHTIDGKE
jgi:hypothetical protein